ncbi:hypothetical protein DFH06DRAFT_190284 [Mycena polygramma]|nr:hypothetical protein DFH06DRAFT_190284 [Mycena polygramma]
MVVPIVNGVCDCDRRNHHFLRFGTARGQALVAIIHDYTCRNGDAPRTARPSDPPILTSLRYPYWLRHRSRTIRMSNRRPSPTCRAPSTTRLLRMLLLLSSSPPPPTKTCPPLLQAHNLALRAKLAALRAEVGALHRASDRWRSMPIRAYSSSAAGR